MKGKNKMEPLGNYGHPPKTLGPRGDLFGRAIPPSLPIPSVLLSVFPYARRTTIRLLATMSPAEIYGPLSLAGQEA